MEKFKRRAKTEHIAYFTLNQKIKIETERVTYYGDRGDIVAMRQVGEKCTLEIYSEDEFHKTFEPHVCDGRLESGDANDFIIRTRQASNQEHSVTDETDEESLAEPGRPLDGSNLLKPPYDN